MKYTTKKFGAKACHERTYANGTRIFFSYATPVCAFVAGRGPVRTTANYSRTTSKHCTMWAREEVNVEFVSANDLKDLYHLHEYEPVWRNV